MIASCLWHGPRPKPLSTLYLLYYLFYFDFLLFKIQIKSNKLQKNTKDWVWFDFFCRNQIYSSWHIRSNCAKKIKANWLKLAWFWCIWKDIIQEQNQIKFWWFTKIKSIFVDLICSTIHVEHNQCARRRICSRENPKQNSNFWRKSAGRF